MLNNIETQHFLKGDRMFNLLKRLGILFILAGGLNLVCANKGSPQTEANYDLDSISKGHLRNRKSFEYMTCRYQIRKGTAETLESALRGEFQNIRKWDVVWIVKGSNVKYVSTCDEVSLKAYQAAPAPRDCDKEVDIRENWGVLSDGRVILKHAPGILGANISMPGIVKADIRSTPFGMGVMGPDEVSNPGSVFQKCLDGKFFGVIEGLETINGAKLVKANVGLSKDRISRTYWLDPKRGFLPIKIDGKANQSEELLYTAIVKDAKKCSGDRWFPMLSIVVYSPQLKKGPLHVREYRVLELNVDHEPNAVAFDTELPTGTQISEPGNAGAFFTLNNAERVSVDNLKQLLERCRSQVP